jgi:hypothetical protein
VAGVVEGVTPGAVVTEADSPQAVSRMMDNAMKLVDFRIRIPPSYWRLDPKGSCPADFFFPAGV